MWRTAVRFPECRLGAMGFPVEVVGSLACARNGPGDLCFREPLLALASSGDGVVLGVN